MKISKYFRIQHKANSCTVRQTQAKFYMNVCLVMRMFVVAHHIGRHAGKVPTALLHLASEVLPVVLHVFGFPLCFGMLYLALIFLLLCCLIFHCHIFSLALSLKER